MRPTYPDLPDLREALPRLCRHPSFYVCQRPDCETLAAQARAQRRGGIASSVSFVLALLVLAVLAVVFPAVRETLGSLISALAPIALNLTLSAAALFGMFLLVVGVIAAVKWLSKFKLARFMGKALAWLVGSCVVLSYVAIGLGMLVMTIGMILVLLDGVL